MEKPSQSVVGYGVTVGSGLGMGVGDSEGGDDIVGDGLGTEDGCAVVGLGVGAAVVGLGVG